MRSATIVPALSFSTSCVSSLRWWRGETLRGQTEGGVPEKMQPALASAMD